MAGIEIKLSENDKDDIVDRLFEKLSQKKSEEVIRTYTVEEVARVTNLTPATVSSHIRKGLLVAHKPGKSWKITENNLKKYLENEE